MKPLLLPILILFLLTTPVFAQDATSQISPQYSKEEKAEIATIVGVVLPGMSKQEVLKTLGEPKKEGRCISTNQEVWYYKYPEEQVIYFSGDIVDRVRYLPEKKKVEVKDVEWL